MKEEILISFYKALFEYDYDKANSLVSDDFMFYHMNFDKYANMLFKQLPERRFNINGMFEVKSLDNDIFQVFLDQRLVVEEQFKFSDDLKLSGTKSKIDCFGKVVYTDFRPRRVLTVRLPRNMKLEAIEFLDSDISCDVYKSKTFDKDGFYLCELSLTENSILTRIEKVVISTDTEEFEQFIVLRGLDYPYQKIRHPRLSMDKNSVILNNDPEKLFRIEITFSDGSVFECPFPDKKEYSFDKEIKSFFMFIDGTAFNYYYNF